MHTPELHSYFERIGYRGATSPTLAVLRELQACHTRAIAFESLDVLLQRPIALDVASLQAKLVSAGRGGYCYEQNLLFQHVLHALGFRTRGLAGRVEWTQPSLPARTHMLLSVETDEGAHLVDVGFGGITPTAPVRLAVGLEQPTPLEPFRVSEENGEYRLLVKIGETWRSLYRFDLQEQHQPDYEMANWYTSTHPRSRFRSTLMCARPGDGERSALLGNQLTVHRRDGHAERRALRDAAELVETLRDVFGLRVPEGAEVHAALTAMLDVARETG